MKTKSSKLLALKYSEHERDIKGARDSPLIRKRHLKNHEKTQNSG